MENSQNYNITIIGGGAGGYSAALEGAQQGLKVALIEKDRIGGTCLNWGCVPTQCLLHDLITFSSFKSCDFIEKGQGSIHVKLDKIMERKKEVIDLLVSGTEKALRGQGVSIFEGEAAFLNPQRITIHPSQKVLETKLVIIATGASSIPDPPFAIDHQYIWDTTDAINMDSIPEDIAIIGGGHRAMTFADIFHLLGSHVNIITEEDRILSDQDREISSRYRRVLKEKNIYLLNNSKVSHIRKGRNGDSIELTVETSKGVEVLRVSRVLVPGIRQSNVKGLHLDKIGICLINGFIPVDSNLMTSVRDVYAIGDVVGPEYAAHKAMRDGRNLVGKFCGNTVKSDKNPIPYCLYTSPEVASIGLTQEEAEKRGNQVVLGYFPFAAGARPAIFGIKEGIIKIVAEKKYGEILGVHIVGPYATELISLASLAIKNELTLKEIGQVIYAHPSFAENFQAAINDTINTMKKY